VLSNGAKGSRPAAAPTFEPAEPAESAESAASEEEEVQLAAPKAAGNPTGDLSALLGGLLGVLTNGAKGTQGAQGEDEGRATSLPFFGEGSDDAATIPFPSFGGQESGGESGSDDEESRRIKNLGGRL